MPEFTRFRSAGVLAAILLMLALLPQTARAEVAGCVAARKQVMLVSGKVRTIMSSRSGRESRMAGVFRNYANSRGMASYALGRYLRHIPAKYKREYYRLASKMLVHLFTTKVGVYNKRIYKIWNCKPKGRGFAIGGAIVESNGNMVIDMHWLMMPRGSKLRVEDIAVAHIWLRQEQRRIFRKVLHKNGGDFKALLAYMRRQISGGK